MRTTISGYVRAKTGAARNHDAAVERRRRIRQASTPSAPPRPQPRPPAFARCPRDRPVDGGGGGFDAAQPPTERRADARLGSRRASAASRKPGVGMKGPPHGCLARLRVGMGARQDEVEHDIWPIGAKTAETRDGDPRRGRAPCRLEASWAPAGP
ncbi:hypothetical protein CDD83_9259 [Cordyceps sp. RAO-2017]|nr:hypothetical protein CDD83_9259 [Cordyceps sp. RAO-2017]